MAYILQSTVIGFFKIFHVLIRGLADSAFGQYTFDAMMKSHFLKIFLLCLHLTFFAQDLQAGIFSGTLSKARSLMQSAFQMSFLPRLPLIFYRDSFNTMFNHVETSIEQLSTQQGNKTVTRRDLMDDKALHVKKSAELALHLKSLFGSSFLAYGLTMMVGLTKELIDSSLLNPNGYREKADLFADHVGAMAVFGKEKFDRALGKKLPYFVKPSSKLPTASSTTALESQSLSPTLGKIENLSNPNKQRDKLVQEYYRAIKLNDTQRVREISELLK